MGEPKKNSLKNTLKEEHLGEKGAVSKSSKNADSKVKTQVKTNGISSLTNKVKRFFSFAQNERFQKIIGLTLLLFGVYLAIAFTSFAFTWEVDQDKVLGDLFTSDVRVENWLGKFGAFISYIFIYKWFGISSYIFVFLAFITGVRITFHLNLLDLNKTYLFSFFFLVFCSITFSYFLSDKVFYLGGAFGYTMTEKLETTFGGIGTGIFLLFTFMVFLVVAFNISFDLTKKANTVVHEPDSIPEEEEKIIPVNEFRENTENLAEEVKEAEEEVLKEEPTLDIVNEDKNTIVEEVETLETETKEPLVLSTEMDNVQFTVEQAEIREEELSPEQLAEAIVMQAGEFDPTLDLSSYQFPPIDLLENYGGSKEIVINTEELNANKNKILKTLGDYGIEIEKIKATVGPTVTLYEIVPAAGVRISKIKNLEDDIALSLSALGIRIIAPIPGKGTIGIEVPNQNAEMVPMRSILSSDKFQNTTMDLPIALGKTISNETFIADLAKMPHLLMAGATGQGKSVGLNAILVSLLYKKHPSQIKFVLVDPKKVELTLFNKIERHFLAKLPDSAEAIITDTKKVIHTLNSLCIEMDQRYDLLKEAQVRNLKEYNAKFIARKLNPNNGHKFLPYIVLVVDEFADLIMTAGKEVETPIARLAQLARAIGIHLIIATQRPSVNIITGTIKANFPARIAFRVTSKIDSRTILDSGGADQLIGRGDMLLSTGNDLIRLQCAFVDTPEVDKICDFIGSQRSYPTAFLLPEYIDENGEGSGKMDDPSERDGLFNQAAEIVVSTQQGSASLLQRRLKLGYNRAGRIVDQLESAGIIGPFEGSKAREVLIKDMLSLEQFLNKTDNNIKS
ncbi:MAG TPA: DNA translocase FtsK [Bacteroidia bacterium]|nr:DNA translocase FtsK [Bacteroidia bacterium]